MSFSDDITEITHFNRYLMYLADHWIQWTFNTTDILVVTQFNGYLLYVADNWIIIHFDLP